MTTTTNQNHQQVNMISKMMNRFVILNDVLEMVPDTQKKSLKNISNLKVPPEISSIYPPRYKKHPHYKKTIPASTPKERGRLKRVKGGASGALQGNLGKRRAARGPRCVRPPRHPVFEGKPWEATGGNRRGAERWGRGTNSERSGQEPHIRKLLFG